jgi:hypothetical protein
MGVGIPKMPIEQDDQLSIVAFISAETIIPGFSLTDKAVLVLGTKE